MTTNYKFWQPDINKGNILIITCPIREVVIDNKVCSLMDYMAKLIETSDNNKFNILIIPGGEVLGIEQIGSPEVIPINNNQHGTNGIKKTLHEATRKSIQEFFRDLVIHFRTCEIDLCGWVPGELRKIADELEKPSSSPQDSPQN